MTSPLTRLTIRQVRRGTLLLAAAAGGMSALVAVQYRTTFADALDGPALRALADNPAIRVLFGPPVALDDPGGFTVWRTGTPIAVLVAVWALLAATRLTRGEEDAGRWDLLLAGRLRTADVLVRCLAAVWTGVLVAGGAVTVALLAAGTDPVGAVVHGAGLLGVGLVFGAAGTLSAQFLPSRPAAAGAAGALVGVGLLLRMLADGADDLAFLAWLTPFGLVARSAPYAGDHPAPLLVLGAVAALLSIASVVVARGRDVGLGLVNLPTRRRPRTRLLGSVAGFAVRRALRPTAGWALGIGAYFLLVGTLTATILRFLADNPRFADYAAAAGFARLNTAEGLAAALFALLAIPAGLYAATRIATMATDETDRRWTSLLALPVRRARLAGIEVAVTTAGILAVLVAAGLAMAATSPLDVGAGLAGVLNVAPVAVLSLGAAVLALGWVPRAVAAVGALPVAGGFALQVVTQQADMPAWLAQLSPFTHLAAVPTAPANWAASAGLLVVATSFAAVGVAGYARRDLVT